MNNEISKTGTLNNEVESFINELKNALEMENSRTPTLYNEMIKDFSLPSKYQNEVTTIISESMNNLSYDENFLYFDYDKNEKTYYLDYYSEGDITRIKMTPEDIKDTHFKEGTFWAKYDEDNIVEATYLKDYVKNNVEAEMESIVDTNVRKG